MVHVALELVRLGYEFSQFKSADMGKVDGKSETIGEKMGYWSAEMRKWRPSGGRGGGLSLGLMRHMLL